ncbi:MAG: hypothetical protein GY774_15625 [Planctomycetes bacterium]|nr:hypothetical protein [Planctomycetota bacterium]
MRKNLICIITVALIACVLTSCDKGPDAFLSGLAIDKVVKDAIADPSVTFRGHTGGGMSGSSRSGWRITYYTKAIATEPLNPKFAVKAITDELSKIIVATGGNISGTGSSGSTSRTSSTIVPAGGNISSAGSSGPTSSTIGFQNARFCYQLNSRRGYFSIWIVPDSDPKVGCHIMIDMYAN